MKLILDKLRSLENAPNQIESIRRDRQSEVMAVKKSLEYSQNQLATAISTKEEHENHQQTTDRDGQRQGARSYT